MVNSTIISDKNLANAIISAFKNLLKYIHIVLEFIKKYNYRATYLFLKLTVIDALRDEMTKHDDMVCMKCPVSNPVLLGKRRRRVNDELPKQVNFITNIKDYNLMY